MNGESDANPIAWYGVIKRIKEINKKGKVLDEDTEKTIDRKRPMRGLKGKNVVVTGGASGIGQATAMRFLEEGCTVCVLDRNAEARARVAQELPDWQG